MTKCSLFDIIATKEKVKNILYERETEMKALYEGNKKLFVSIVVAVCVLVLAGAGVFVWQMTSQDTKAQANAKSVQTMKEKEKEKEEQKDSDKFEEDDTELEEVTAEAVTAEALEVVEDSELDVVEPEMEAQNKMELPETTPEPQTQQETTEAPAPAAPAPAAPAPVSNMAQNVPYPYEIHVNKQMNCVTVYAMDTSGAYSIPLKAMVCSTGNATPLGTFRTPAKYIWKVLKGNVWGQYSTRVTGSILFHSVPYSTSRKDALINKYYNKLGTTASAGCIRLTTIDAKWIYDNCPLGTTVVIYNDSNPGPLGKPTAMKVDASNKWDPTDPDPANPWRGRVLRIEGVQNQVIERGSGFNAMNGIVAVDTNGADVTANVQVSTNADVNTPGMYAIHYSISDALGNVATADASLTVVDTQAPVFASVPAKVEGIPASQLTRERLLAVVTVTDNGQAFPDSQIQVQMPVWKAGENVVRFTATDSAGNSSTASTVVVCDMTVPVISKKNNAVSMLALNQTIDQNTALGRISVRDDGPVTTQCKITAEDWGWRLDYTATDKGGNVAVFTDHVSYPTYEFTGSQTITVSSVKDINALMQELTLKDSFGRESGDLDKVQINISQKSANVYGVTYKYSYTSPVGTKTAKFTRTVVVQ